MRSISLKLEDSLVREMEQAMKFQHYTTKSEFIRAAIREKVARIKKEMAN